MVTKKVMKKEVFLCIVLTVAALGLSCTSKRNVAMTNEDFIEKFSWGTQFMDSTQVGRDADISSAIKSRFSESRLISGSNINVDTTNGSVTLNGKVSNQEKVDRALQIARSVDGVKSVNSNLIVD
ncbi:MAG TPA: BON domain-containing protein [Acidobacteriota bacterium]|nr:BON domain-containing protein [Acidobacteriota bacterium]